MKAERERSEETDRMRTRVEVNRRTKDEAKRSNFPHSPFLRIHFNYVSEQEKSKKFLLNKFKKAYYTLNRVFRKEGNGIGFLLKPHY